MASILPIGDKWRAQIRMKGEKITHTFKTKREAESWAREVEAEIDRGVFSNSTSLREITFAQLADRYVKEIGSIKPFGRTKVFSIRILRAYFGNTKLSHLDEQAVIDFAKWRMQSGAGPVSIAIDISYLSTILKIARSLWKVRVENHATNAREMLKYMGLIKKSASRERRPTEDEINQLCAYFRAKENQKIPMWDLIPFAIGTAMRAGEIMRLRWDDLNHEDKTIIIRDRKDPKEKIGNNQAVPLLKVGEIDTYAIASQQPIISDLIFPYNAKSISSIFPRACAELGIVDLHFHDLRHEGCSRLFEAGYTIEQVALVSGHKNWKQLQRYTQIKAKNLHR